MVNTDAQPIYINSHIGIADMNAGGNGNGYTLANTRIGVYKIFRRCNVQGRRRRRWVCRVLSISQ
ncbi:hypothetical protein [Paraflavitalea speifideaquila]|uniref:hypothetical protein n=1 Tax=Paraflavitalea speifideaquila TaxID=3076558 RepID=UPI0028E71972|nr:hypothetical protein [Paraflavitalea speifideiaquila]